MKKLIFEDSKKIDDLKEYYSRTVQNLNELLTEFHACQQEHLIQTEAQAMAFAADPVKFLYEVNGGAGTRFEKKHIPGLRELRAKITEITGRPAKRYTITTGNGTAKKIPGFKINNSNKMLIIWLPELRKFSINTQELEKLFAPYQKFAEGDQLEKVEAVESLCEALNKHSYPIVESERELIASKLNLRYYAGYKPDYSRINL
jgi:hypothetical protein